MPRYWYQRPGDSLYTAYNLFSMIAGLQQRLPQIEIREHAENLQSVVTQCLTYTEGEFSPRSFVVSSFNESVIIGFCGAQNVRHFAGLLNGYFAQPANTQRGTINHYNPFAFEVVRQWDDYVVSRHDWPDTMPILIGGYSYGCVPAVALYTQFKARWPQRQIFLVTYGSPKPGDDTLRFLANQYPGSATAWCNDSDPVPYVFPDADNAPAWHALLTRNASGNANLYVQSLFFNEISGAGAVTKGVTRPSLAGFNQEDAIAGWMSGRQGWNTSGHHWTTYKWRLYLASARYPDAPADVTDAQAAVLQAAQGDPAVMDLPPFVPETVLPSPPAVAPAVAPLLPFNQSHEGRRQKSKTVYWNGIPVAEARSRGQARSLRKALRTMTTGIRTADRFYEEAVADAAALQRQLDAFQLPSSIH